MPIVVCVLFVFLLLFACGNPVSVETVYPDISDLQLTDPDSATQYSIVDVVVTLTNSGSSVSEEVQLALSFASEHGSLVKLSDGSYTVPTLAPGEKKNHTLRILLPRRIAGVNSAGTGQLVAEAVCDQDLHSELSKEMRIDPILNIEPSTTQADSFPIAKNRGYAGEFTVDTDEHWLSTSIPAGNSIRIYGAGNSDTVYLDAYVAAETAARFSGQLQGFSQSIQIDNERSQSVEVQLLMTTDTPQSYWILCEEVRS